jgi:hypothetical protein
MKPLQKRKGDEKGGGNWGSFIDDEESMKTVLENRNNAIY